MQQEIQCLVNIVVKLEKFSEPVQGDQGGTFCVLPLSFSWGRNSLHHILVVLN
jgi:hypothetical protein